MAYNEQLADRICTILADTPYREQEMFGGVAFMIDGHMACGVVGDELMIRLGKDGVAAALTEACVREMDFTGKPMSTMAFVTAEGCSDDAALADWVGRASAFVRTLPPK